VWQTLFESVGDSNFMIVAVAMDSDPQAARPWIEAARPGYVTLIDRNHLVASLYNMVNVPQAVWIDEEGRVVRPVETAGSIDILREFDPAAGGFPPDAITRSQQAKRVYLEAVKDWAQNGAASPHAFDPRAAAGRVTRMDEAVARAHATFRLGRHLQETGRDQEAEQAFEECRRLHPSSWNMFRQTTPKLDNGIAASPEFWNKVMALGDDAYYAHVDMQGMP
jgi:hypothetical protein